MAFSRGKHRKSATGRNLARVALAGAVVATPFALAAPA
ncbi:transglycosylase, partial [Saccharopolyspora kobensis]